jgi:hypothetical protein
MKRTKIRPTHDDLAVDIRSVEVHPTLRQVPDESPNSMADLDRRLDMALEETFPASDPVSVICC